MTSEYIFLESYFGFKFLKKHVEIAIIRYGATVGYGVLQLHIYRNWGNWGAQGVHALPLFTILLGKVPLCSLKVTSFCLLECP